MGAAPPPVIGLGAAPPEAPKRKSPTIKIAGVVVSLLLIVCVAVAVIAVRSLLSGDGTEGAKAGDCITNLPEVAAGENKEANDAKIVACTDASAQYKVEGRVDDKTEAEASDQAVCSQYSNVEFWYRVIPTRDKGYVLCLSQIEK